MNTPRVIAVTISDSTEPGATAAADYLAQAGWKAQLFTVEDGGGEAYEQFLSKGQAAAALDYTLADLAAARLRGTEVSKNRLTAAATRGLPQVIVPGGLDCAPFRSRLPSGLEGRAQHLVKASLTLVRTSAEDTDAFGREIAFKASASKGSVAVVVPRGGLSHWGGPRRPMDDPLADKMLLDSLYLWRSPQVQVIESDRHVNDYLFAQIAAERLLKMLTQGLPARWR